MTEHALINTLVAAIVLAFSSGARGLAAIALHSCCLSAIDHGA